ncbi:hypothetical protein OGAPHI_003973 [Ogataea philodendri]|uniref:XPG-I domain-containing protein n=1 Tax=Ogataea philodendri TaxID=1378263 RepID=A0A9P8P674_9ASCO|nr:uncharacterized protein OGAPHI_003973 [Ogataea philodendri]KAH3665785.1 hypothetical protein OGAPHI_003973 [Ogataea philodendri]
MTIPGLWEKLGEYGVTDERVPLRVFTRRFLEENKRHIRLGIDVYQWIFELTQVPSQYKGDNVTISDERVLLNFISRVRELIRLHVSFVFVFDGPYKVHKRRWGEGDVVDDDYYLEYFQTNLEIQQSDPSSASGGGLIALLKKMLDFWNISYVQAAGEAEIELARLNDCGIIDALVSNDADGFVHGAQLILKNFSRWMADAPVTQTFTDKQEPEIYVTPCRMSKIYELLGLDRERLVFLACLNGSDFSQGVPGLGITRSISLAQVGSKIPGETDFSHELSKIYLSEGEERLMGIVPYKKEEREVKLNWLNDIVQKAVLKNAKQYFGKNFNGTINFPPDYYFMLHFYPFLSSEAYAFKRFETNCVDTEVPTIRLSSLPQPNSIVLSDNQVWLQRRGSFKTVFSPGEIIYDKLIGDADSMEWFQKPKFPELTTLRLPLQRSAREFFVEHLSDCYMLRIIYNLPKFKGNDIFINMYKEAQFPLKRRADEEYIPIWTEEQYQVKYNKELIFGPYFGAVEMFDENYNKIDFSQQKPDFTWVPRHLLELSPFGKSLIEDYEIRSREKKSPRKSPRKSPKKSPKRQLSTLDNLLRSPIKRKLVPDSETLGTISPEKHKPDLAFVPSESDEDILESPTKRRNHPNVNLSGLRTSLFKSPKPQKDTSVIDLTTPPEKQPVAQTATPKKLTVLSLDTSDEETDKLEDEIDAFFKK